MNIPRALLVWQKKRKKEPFFNHCWPNISDNLLSSLPPLPCLASSRMASPLWLSPSSRATTRWSQSYWRMILKARSACLPCTLLPARTTPSRQHCSSRMTTMLMSSRRYAHGSVWLGLACVEVKLMWCYAFVPMCPYCGYENFYEVYELHEAVVDLVLFEV